MGGLREKAFVEFTEPTSYAFVTIFEQPLFPENKNSGKSAPLELIYI